MYSDSFYLDQKPAHKEEGSTVLKNLPARTILIEEDCRMGDSPDVLTRVQSLRHQPDLYQRPPLHIVQLTETEYVVFDPFANDTLALLNMRQIQLLNEYQVPQTLPERNFTAKHSTNTYHDDLEYLCSMGLLQPVGEQVKLQPSHPRSLVAWLHVTNECNLRCDYCYIYKTPSKMEVQRGKQAIDAVFRSALAQGFCQIKLKYAGGEPTLNFALVLILHQYAQTLAAQYELGLDGVLLSNGVALTKRMIMDLQSHQLRLMISLDGLDDFHDRQRQFINGKGSFDHVVRALNRLAEHDFVPSVAITVSQRNLSGLPALVEFLLARQLPFSINFFRENGCAGSFDNLAYQEAEIIAAMKAAFAIIEQNLPDYSLLGSLLDRTGLDQPHGRPCGVGQSYMVIDQQGGIAKCHMQIEQTVTNINAPDPLKLLMVDSKGVQNISVDEKTGCQNCEWRYWCAGGCPALTYRATGRYDVKSPNCNIYKALFPEVIRLEGFRLLKQRNAN